MKSSKFKIITATFLLTLTILAINGPFKIIKEELKKPMRSMIEKNELSDMCDKARGSLVDKYKKGVFDREEKKYKDMGDHDKEVIDYLRNKEFDDIKGYLRYLALRFVTIIALDIVFIFLWICYCSCCCNPCCCCKEGDSEPGCCAKFSYFVAFLFSVGIIVCSILGFVYATPIKKNVKGAECSAYKMFYHLKYGYDDSQLSNWPGISSITNKMASTLKNLNNFSTTGETDPNKITDSSLTDEWKGALNVYREAYNYSANITNWKKSDSYSSLTSLEGNLKSFSEQFDKIEKDYVDEGKKYLDDYAYDYAKLSYIIIFGLFLIFGLLNLFCFSVYKKTCKCVKCIYIIVWNIETLFMLIFILIGVAFGVVGVLGNNVVSVVQYTFDSENLNSSEPIILSEAGDVVKYFEVCFNGNGDLSETLNIKSYLSDLDGLLNLSSEVENYLKNLNETNDTKKQSILNGLKKTNETMIILKNIFDNSSSSIHDLFNCRFLKSDANIFLDEVKDYFFKTCKRLSIIIITSSLALGVTVFFGLIVMNRYKEKSKKSKKKSKKEEDTQSEIRSSENSEERSKENIKAKK